MMQKELRDQSAHFSVVFLSLVLFGLAPNPITGMVVGFLWGLTREVTEEGSPVTVEKVKLALGSKLDLTFWALGGLVAGLLVCLI